MPLDGYSYLTSYGWTGKGSGLRVGAIDRPITVRQKQNFAGVGKDRDEAFPFWDHLFTVASKAITIKIATDEEEEDVVRVKDFRIRRPLQTYILKEEDTPSSEIQRTSTGIISNRRPITGTPVSGLPSGAATPVPESAPRLSLIATAKREAARRGLYAKFFRGPILGPNEPDAAPKSNPSPSHSNPMSDDALKATTKQRKRKKSKDRAETKDEKRMRRRLKEQSRGARKNRDQDVEESCLSPPSKKKRRR